MPGITHWNHPGFLHYFPSNSDLSSVLADLVSAGLGVQGMSWQTSPAATEVEDVVMEWLREMVGLPDTFTGVIEDTASTSTFTALLCARERTSAFSQNRGGLQAEDAPLVVYASDQAHSSIPKAALLAGFGAEHLRLIETDDEHALRLDLLERAVEDDLAAGRRPCAVVAAVGTTATTALDPVAGIAALCERHGIWLHVDAALAGTAMICPEYRWMWEGVERADSVVFNPHKWMGTGFDLSAYYVRDPEHLVRVMSTDPSYLRTAQDGQVRNLRDWGIPLGRRFRALKLWFLLRAEGVEGLQARVRRDVGNAEWLAEQVVAAPEWGLMAPAPLQTVSLRHVPPALAGDEEALAAHNAAIVAARHRRRRVLLRHLAAQGPAHHPRVRGYAGHGARACRRRVGGAAGGGDCGLTAAAHAAGTRKRPGRALLASSRPGRLCASPRISGEASSRRASLRRRGDRAGGAGADPVRPHHLVVLVLEDVAVPHDTARRCRSGP